MISTFVAVDPDENVLAASCGTRHRDLHRPGAGGWKVVHALREIDRKFWKALGDVGWDLSNSIYGYPWRVHVYYIW